ncbi:hypothetical protein COO60DRAFT_955837 [Scenedesmus sp. NREL 46B-D3]|nr:hypothetical protein COO60DRAFT_955837 [Scenedesmus sp. NREL 46B-D3]
MRSHASSFKSSSSFSSGYTQLTGWTAPTAAAAAAAAAQGQAAAAAMWWTAPVATRGMVWGMPVYTVAKVPGIVVPPVGGVAVHGSSSSSTLCSQQQAPADASKGSAAAAAAAAAGPVMGTPAAGLPVMLPPSGPTCWPAMPATHGVPMGVGMPGTAAAATGGAAAGMTCMQETCLQAWAWACRWVSCERHVPCNAVSRHDGQLPTSCCDGCYDSRHADVCYASIHGCARPASYASMHSRHVAYCCATSSSGSACPSTQHPGGCASCHASWRQTALRRRSSSCQRRLSQHRSNVPQRQLGEQQLGMQQCVWVAGAAGLPLYACWAVY